MSDLFWLEPDKPVEELTDEELNRAIWQLGNSAKIMLDGEVKCATWGPLLAVRDAGIAVYAKRGAHYVARKNIPRAAAVLRLQGYEVTIEKLERNHDDKTTIFPGLAWSPDGRTETHSWFWERRSAETRSDNGRPELREP